MISRGNPGVSSTSGHYSVPSGSIPRTVALPKTMDFWNTGSLGMALAIMGTTYYAVPYVSYQWLINAASLLAMYWHLSI